MKTFNFPNKNQKVLEFKSVKPQKFKYLEVKVKQKYFVFKAGRGLTPTNYRILESCSGFNFIRSSYRSLRVGTY